MSMRNSESWHKVSGIQKVTKRETTQHISRNSLSQKNSRLLTDLQEKSSVNPIYILLVEDSNIQASLIAKNLYKIDANIVVLRRTHGDNLNEALVALETQLTETSDTLGLIIHDNQLGDGHTDGTDVVGSLAPKYKNITIGHSDDNETNAANSTDTKILDAGAIAFVKKSDSKENIFIFFEHLFRPKGPSTLHFEDDSFSLSELFHS